MRLHHERLRRKGWTEQEIQRAQEGLNRAEERKHPALAFLEKAVFWGLLFLTLVGVFSVSMVIVPALILLRDPVIVIVLALLGLCLGALFALLIKDIEWLERKHHAIAFTLLTVIGILNIWFIVEKTATIEQVLGIVNLHHGVLLGIVFAAALMTPYAIHLATESTRHRR